MSYRASISILSLFLCGSVSASEIPDAVTSFVRIHCFDCHTGKSAEAGLDLESLSTDLDSGTFDKWVRVFDRVDAGEMPPKDSATLERREKYSFLKSTSNWLVQHQSRDFATHGRVRGRRLTNLQLERTLHDLLGIDIPLADRMPDEPKTHGFTGVASGQSVSHFQLQTHLSVVDAALDEAFRRAFGKPDEWKKEFTARQVARQRQARRCREPEMLNGAAVVWSARTIFYGRLPITTARDDGWYRLKVNASGLNVPEKSGTWCTVRTGKCVSSAPMLTSAGAFEATRKPKDRTFEAWLSAGDMFEVRPGDGTIRQARFEGGQIGAGEGTPQKVPGVAIHRIELQRFHKGPPNEKIRQWLIGDLKFEANWRGQNAKLHSDRPKQDAARLIRAFANRAFRVPVTNDIVQPYIQMVKDDLAKGISFLQALRGGYRAVLCSPRFLYFQENVGQLDDFALASRLSYFLWNTMPDYRLRQLAKSGQLRNPEVLRQQTNRMLNDSRGKNFVKDFAREWLDLSEIDFTEPDRKLYRGFDVIVQESMLQETHTFLQEMLSKNLSVSNLIDSRFTFLNNRLARHYGIDRVQGDEFVRVALRPEDKRGGVLTQGSILKVTANGTTTSPVLRGVWVSDRLLGQRIPPPPEGVPAIEPDIRGAKTIREMLQKHKSDPACASCHVKVDPPGFALENFDPAGRWRETYASPGRNRRTPAAKINAGFQMPDGTDFRNLQEFQNLALRNKSEIAKNVVEKLVTYGTGATCSFVDRKSVEIIVKDTAKTDYGLRSLVHAVVASDIFGNK